MNIRIPILRFGQVYKSLETNNLIEPVSGRLLATISKANAGMIRRDLLRAREAARILRALPSSEVWDLCAKAGDLFLNGRLPIGADDQIQTPQEYVECLSATSGLPHSLCRQNMVKIHHVLTDMRSIVCGLTRGLDDLSVFDHGSGRQNGVLVSFTPVADALGVVLPSNSPGVNSIWLPAVALKIPVIIKPGGNEPWTPWRIITALRTAGLPDEAFGFYPTDHEGADAIMHGCSRAIIFGDDTTLRPYAKNPSVQTHGTGRSKILIGEDAIDQWQQHLDVLYDSVVDNGGRSCINASSILVPRHGDAVANALAQRLAVIKPRLANDPKAMLSAFASPDMARQINTLIDRGLEVAGARDVTAMYRYGPRLKTMEGGTFLHPTVVRCPSMAHPLGNCEFLFPFTSVVEVSQDQMLNQIGPTLALTALTQDPVFVDKLIHCPQIDRLNLGPVPTSRVQWDQPHEGNLFDLLYRRRALQCRPM